MDHTALTDALLAFYNRIGLLDPPADADQHLRFARDLEGTFRGSEWGASAWATDEGRAVEGLLLEDTTIRGLFGPPPRSRLGELRGRVSSFFEAVEAADPRRLRDRILAGVPLLLTELVSDPSVWATWLVRGVEPPDEPFYIPPGFVILAATPEALDALGIGGLPGGLTTVMADVRTAVAINIRALRAEQGAYAVGAADGFGEIYLDRLLDAIWIATGILPSPFIRYSSEEATYPAFRSTMDRFDHERAGRDPGGEASIEVLRERLEGVFARYHSGHAYWWDLALEDEADIASARVLRSVAGLADALRREADGALAAMLAFAMADGLLRERSDAQSLVNPRLVLLLGANPAERRTLKKQFFALEEIRHAIAHGSRPDVDDIERFLGSLGEADLGPFRDVLTPLRKRSREIGRKLLAAALYLKWDLGERDEWGAPSLVHRMHRAQCLELLARAQQGDAGALQTLDEWLPGWVKLRPTERNA